MSGYAFGQPDLRAADSSRQRNGYGEHRGHLTVSQARNTRLPSLAAALRSRDAEEGVLAFREKRAPAWTGR